MHAPKTNSCESRAQDRVKNGNERERVSPTLNLLKCLIAYLIDRRDDFDSDVKLCKGKKKSAEH